MPPHIPVDGPVPSKLKKGAASYTRREVAKHNELSDLWVIIDNKVYDLTNWQDKHPGGWDILKTQAGRDASEGFSNFHHEDTIEMLPNYFIGDIVPDDRIAPTTGEKKRQLILEDYRKLVERCRQLGYFKSNKYYYTWKVFSHFLMIAGIAYCLQMTLRAAAANATILSWMWIAFCSVLTAVFYSQNGWLSHDFLHHQVFEDRRYGNFVGFILGGLFQGFSGAWWKNKHNTHHACSNELDNDPDIDQLPVLSFHPVLLRGGRALQSALAPILIRIQVYSFLPVIMLARWNWCARSVAYLLESKSANNANRNVELFMIGLHWSIKMWVVFAYLPLWLGLSWLIASEAMGGALIGLFFVLNHNGMHVFTEEEFKNVDFVTLQVMTSRDIKPNWFTNFFSGGLNYQIEHHLLPTMPRHNFHKVAPLVDELCAKHKIPIHRVDLWTGLKEFWGALAASQKCIATNDFHVPPLDIMHYH